MSLNDNDLIQLYRNMLKGRRYEERIIQMVDAGNPPLELPHSQIGEEAISVGACYKLRPDDYVVPGLRNRSVFLMRGVTLREIASGIFGKATGPARGKVTSHHMGDPARGIIGTNGIIGGHLAAASGVALACKMRKSSSVVLCFFGDGASSQGDFHEACNFSGVNKLPVLYIINNNRWAASNPAMKEHAVEDLADRAKGYGFPGVAVDGNDVIAVHKVVQEAVDRARRGEGSTLIEGKTYRMRGHTEVKGFKEFRDEEEVESWRRKDPIKRLEKRLMETGALTDKVIENIEKELKAEIDDAFKFSAESPFPEPEELFRDVYGSPAVPLDVKEPDESAPSKEISMGMALNEALREEMSRDDSVFLIGLGLDTGSLRPSMRPTSNLGVEFPGRILGTPLAEAEFVGAAAGAAVVGMRPVVEVMFADHISLAFDNVVHYMAKERFNYGGKASVPMVVRLPYGAYRSGLFDHSQSPESWFLNIPGLKIVMPSTPRDAKGLLKAAIRDDDPVLFFEHKMLYAAKGNVPLGEYVIPLGKADVKRKGEDVTIVATGYTVPEALSASNELQKEGISAEVVDPRTILPLDKDTIIESVKKTGKLVIAHEAPVFGGFGGEIAATVAEEALDYLNAPIVRVGAPFTVIPFSEPLLNVYTVKADKIIAAVKKVTG